MKNLHVHITDDTWSKYKDAESLYSVRQIVENTLEFIGDCSEQNKKSDVVVSDLMAAIMFKDYKRARRIMKSLPVNLKKGSK